VGEMEEGIEIFTITVLEVNCDFLFQEFLQTDNIFSGNLMRKRLKKKDDC